MYYLGFDFNIWVFIIERKISQSEIGSCLPTAQLMTRCKLVYLVKLNNQKKIQLNELSGLQVTAKS